MENVESVLDELNVQGRDYYDKKKTAEIPKMLEDYINHLAKTGDTLFPWSKVKSVIRHKLELVIANFREICPTENLPPCPNVEPFHYETMRDKILVQFDSFNCAPFTIQRLCELLCAPRKHYKRTDKFMRGIEKNLLVVSTVDPEQRKRVDSTSQTLVNGVVEVNAASNNRALTHVTFAQRPTSAASDVASVSDADSGISDTEDEDKLPHLIKQQQEEPVVALTTSVEEQSKVEVSANEQQVKESPIAMETETGTEPVPESETVSSEAVFTIATPTEEVKPSSPAAAPSEIEPAAIISTELTTTAVQQLEEPVASLPMEQTDESVAVIEMTESTPLAETVLQETPGADKKRPLEREENNEENEDEEHSPDAKQPRIFSPDKVMDAPVTVLSEPTIDDTMPVIHDEQEQSVLQPAAAIESSVPNPVEVTDLVQPVVSSVVVTAEVGDQ
uniref:EOG090X0BWU n=1 Tax=Eubosmina coregoni TaxID=186181 RepID=A0A4Y7LLI2_9CRUS|nr:EOG090X0BWU [Eubosmina coregoni]SVE70018.1 EOG090X0BWU [Eubosmina coregoni]